MLWDTSLLAAHHPLIELMINPANPSAQMIKFYTVRTIDSGKTFTTCCIGCRVYEKCQAPLCNGHVREWQGKSS